MIQKQIRILENRLDKALVKFNEALAHNKKLREKKKQMANIIELSNLSYEQRDNSQMEIAAIEQANRKEQEDFEEQMLELGRLLENDLKISTSQTAGAAGRSGSPAPDPAAQGSMSAEDETKLKKKVNKGAWGLAKDKVDVQVSMERVQNFEEAFNKIKAATGISDIEELVRTFIKNEDQNFSLFNYVSEQTNEVEKLEEQIQ